MSLPIPMLLCAATLVAGGCVSKLTKRHARPTNAEKLTVTDVNGRTSLSLTSLEIEEESARRSIFELDGRGQDAYLTELGRRVQDVSTLTAGARAELTPLPPPSARIDLTKIKRRLVAGLVHRPFSEDIQTTSTAVYYPADRVVWSEVELEIVDQDFAIVGYDKVNTGYETVDLGKLTRSTSFSLTGSGELSASLGQTRSKVTDALGSQNGASTGLSGGVGASATGGETLTEEVQLRKRYVSLAVLLAPGGKRLQLIREGVDGIDLTGAVTIDAKIEATPKNRSTSQVFLLGDKKLPDGTTGLSIERKMKVVPKIHRLRLCGSSTSIIRHVTKRGHTLREGDDKVEFVRSQNIPTHVDIELPREFTFYVEVKTKDGTEVLHFRSPTMDTQEATFATYAEAVRIRGWILANPTTLDKFKDWSGGYELVTSKNQAIELDGTLTVTVKDQELTEEPEETLPDCSLAAPAPTPPPT